jgi:hypothetical protein
MVSSLFISYSRREAPFVDSLLRELEKRELKVWLDYRTLVPGRPWQKQIYEGLVNTEVVLLVVSQESIASKNVAWEWKQALELKKRIILVIFEAVKLPPELEDCEWVDLRGRFKAGIKELVRQLATSGQPRSVPPQKGIKLSPVVGTAIAASLVLSVLSLPSLWTIYVSYHLFLLPYKIIKRNFSFFHVQNALLMLPIVNTFTFWMVNVTSEAPPEAARNILIWSWLLNTTMLVKGT